MTRRKYYKLKVNPHDGHYEDSGCPIATEHLGYQSRCLNCPFPKCIYEEDGGRWSFLKEKRDAEIRRLRGEGKNKEELASIFGISIRTVERVIKDWCRD